MFDEPSSKAGTNHFSRFLEELSERGISQAQVAAAAGVAPQYISDVRHNRRRLGELIARRLSQHFNVDYAILVGGSKSEIGIGLAGSYPTAAEGWLPVFPHPITGDPQVHPDWEGSYVLVPPIVAPRLALAPLPYALRFQNDDVDRRLHKNDLVLISQQAKESAQISVVRFGKKCFLARHKNGRWVRVANGKPLARCTAVGHCLGILWSALS